MAFSLKLELLRVCILFKAVHVSFYTQFSQGFRSDSSYSTYICSQWLAQTRGTPLAFRSDKSYFAPFACATRSFYLKLFTSCKVTSATYNCSTGFSLRQELLDLYLFAAVSPDKGNSAGFSLRQELLSTFRFRY